MSRDLAIDRPEDAGRPGGVVVHAGRTLARLGARVRVVTRLRPDDAPVLLAPLVADGVEVLALPGGTTTTYANEYGGAVDRHVLRDVSEPIGPSDVPWEWRHARIVQLGPLHPDDLRPETAAALSGLRGLDLQGLVRVPGGETLRASPALRAFLAHVEVVQASEAELRAALDGDALARFIRRHGLREVLVTRGARGVTVVTPAGTTDVAAVRAAGPRVGAGDAFLAAHLLGRAAGADPVAAATAAARVAALHCTHGEIPPGTRLS